MANTKCIVCDQLKKYKCPKCYNPYCSIDCFKVHKCENKKLKVEEEKEKEIQKSDYIDESVKLPKEKLELLRTSKKILKYISNQKLRKVIKDIDNSKYRLKTLNQLIENDKDFEIFCQELLDELGYIEHSTGQFIS